MVTKQQIQDWKDKHGFVFAVHVYPLAVRNKVLFDENGKPLEPDKSEKLTGYFRKPTAAVWGEATKYIRSDMVRYYSELFSGCWLGGDQRIFDDDELRLSAAIELPDLFQYRETEVEKL